MNTDATQQRFAFFGTAELSVTVLNKLKTAGFVPSLIISAEDKPKGRKLILTPTETKVWAEENTIPCIQPVNLKKPEGFEVIQKATTGFDFFVVVSYGKIIPQNILDIPRLGTLNVHPSLLPKLRGASPIKSAILTEHETGVTIIRLDAEMDHGPIVAQKKSIIENWPPYANTLEKQLGEEGGKLLAEILPDWIHGKITEKEQDHSAATICGKIEKTDGVLELTESPEKNLRKIRAYETWPTAYFFQNDKRIIVTKAHIENNELVIEKIIPEGKKEMPYQDFLRGNPSI
jgi:methionyl-tRNA formyltransferase